MTFTSIQSRLARFVRDEAGLAAVEYAVMAVVVVGVVLVASEPLQEAVSGAFERVKTAVDGAGGGGDGGGT